MGKSGGRKKKGGSNQASVDKTNSTNNINSNSSATPIVNGGVDLDSSIFLKRAHELKEEGNKRFQSKDFAGALEQYEIALKLTPKTHPDRAVFHSNRAACMIQMKPIDYDSVIAECTLALQVQPKFARALLRRARAFEAVGKPDMALLDVQALLASEPNHRDALDIAQRLRLRSADLQSRPSPAALGASAVRGAPIAGLGPCLPARPLQKKPSPSPGPGPTNPKATLPSVSEQKSQFPKLAAKPVVAAKEAAPSSSPLPPPEVAQVPAAERALKLVYDHDIRLAQMPPGCGFRVLREIVAKRFPSSKSVLVKYKDSDGDLVTITSTAELRSAEACVGEGGTLRLHVVEVSPEQEPPLPDEEEEEEEEDVVAEKPAEENESNVEVTVVTTAEKESPAGEVEMDDWLFAFAQLFRTHVGIEPDSHMDLHELGMELCSEALEETVTSEAAQGLFDKAASKFQEVAALAFFKWGNVHMCAARKRISLDDSAATEVVSSQLRAAYDWVKDKYTLAKGKYEEPLAIKPDFYEGLLALGQQQFEMAKLHWSYALARKINLSQWDCAQTLELFDSAQEKMRVATEMWERLEEQRPRDEPLKRRKGGEEVSSAEEAAVMRSQIHLFWGNMLFERSQVECNLATGDWEKNLNAAVERFKLAGASETDIATALKNHCSNDGKKEEAPKNGEVVVNVVNFAEAAFDQPFSHNLISGKG